MKTTLENIELINNETRHTFELHINGDHAFIDYLLRDKKYYLIHTEVPEKLQGQGVASALVAKVLKHLEKENYKIVPRCAFVIDYLRKNPKWTKLVDHY